MNVNVEYCDPFNGLEDGFWMKVEHCGRYMWAAQWLKERRCKSAADIACANGYGSRILSRMIGRVTAVDRNEDYLNKAEYDDSVQYICCDLDREPLPEEINDTDAIVCFETLEHLQKPEAAVQAFFERLSDGGYLLLSVPNARYELLDDDGKNKDPFHLHIFSPDTVRAFLENAGFVIEEVMGQDICNRIVARISELEKTGKIRQGEAEKLWGYDRKRIKLFAEIFGKPESVNVEQSYSLIYICRKSRAQ